MTLAAELEAAIPGRLRRGVELAPRTTMKVGGAADLFAEPATVAELDRLLAVTVSHGVRPFVLGAGSNLVVADRGVRGVVVSLQALAGTQIHEGEAGAVAEVAAGTMNAHAVRAIHKAGYVGAEFLALVPGQFGGAVAMNAGTKWGELSEILASATLVDGTGTPKTLTVGDLAPRYRHGGVPPGCVVVSGRVHVVPGDPADAKARIRAEKQYRAATQPYQHNCSGSFFANPPGDAAGRLIEASGLKGLRWGGAEISAMHANFIVNLEGGRAEEIVHLMALARQTVQRRFGVALRPEVRLVGFEPDGYDGDPGAFLDAVEIPGALRDAAQAWEAR